MVRKFREWVGKFNGTETITAETRREVILRYMLWTGILMMVLLSSIRLVDWMKDPSQTNSFYLANSLFGTLAFLLTLQINNRHHSSTASLMFLIIAFHMCLTTYPIRNPDQVLLYFSLPTAAASFIRHPKSSLVYALICFVGSNLLFTLHFLGGEYPVFSSISLFVIAVITWQVAATLQKMTDQVFLAYDTTIEGWSQALELRSQETDGHSQRVVELTLRLVKIMKVEESRWAHIRRGILLHDIGKMGIPDTILCKPGPLTACELATMHKHPEYARVLLNRIPYLVPALDIPYYHHERWDGKGYPLGLKGEEIPLEVRIFSVVDVWDAMRSKRSYRPEVPEQHVIEYLLSESGRAFDPQVIKAFFEMMGFGLIERERHSLHVRHVDSNQVNS